MSELKKPRFPNITLGVKGKLARLKERVDIRIREKAIARAKTRIYLHGKTPDDYAPEILETIVKEEEDKLKSELKDRSIIVLLAALGLSFWS